MSVKLFTAHKHGMTAAHRSPDCRESCNASQHLSALRGRTLSMDRADSEEVPPSAGRRSEQQDWRVKGANFRLLQSYSAGVSFHLWKESPVSERSNIMLNVT